MSPSDRWFKTRRRLIGVVFLAVFGLAIWLSLAIYQKKFTPAAFVTLYASSVGNEMHNGAEVVVRGVQVGEVRQVAADGSGARLELAIEPRMVPLLPANVTAEMLPTTIFGEREVDLMLPARPVARRLVSGSVIGENRTGDALELEQVLNNLLPMLTAVQPQQLSFTLTAIAQGLNGRGTQIGQTLVTLNSYLRKLRPQLPKLDADIKELVKVTKTFNQAAPDIVSALKNFAVVSKTVYQQRANLADLLNSVTTASDNLRTFLDGNSANIIGLSAASTPSLDLLARYSPEFPCTLSALVAFEPNINRVLGAGTDQPGLHVHVHVVPSLGRYLPDRNTPVYGDNLGPHCYSVPFRGITLHDGTAPGSGKSAAGSTGRSGTGGSGTGAGQHKSSATGHTTSASTGSAGADWLAMANSPQQDELVNELAALTLRRSPRSMPAWSSLLIGPLYRGEEVVLR